MSAELVSHRTAAVSTHAQAPSAAATWWLWTTALVLGLVFFVTEHNLATSLAEDYTQTADEMELTALGGNTVRRLAFFVLAAFGLWLAATAKQSLRLNPWLAWPMAGYLFVAGASFLWSVDPGMCLRRLIVSGCCALAAVGIARRHSIQNLCLLTVAIIGPLVAAGLIAEVALGTFRPWSSEYRFAGSVHPNTQNMYLTALALASLGLARSQIKTRVLFWGIFYACLVLSVLTKSRTGNAATLLALASAFLVAIPWQQKITIAFAGSWITLVGVWLLWVFSYDPLTDFRVALLLGRAEDSDTLSGRAFIWPLAWHFACQRPWLGYGYESFWNPTNIDIVSEELQWGVREAHCGYLDLLLSTGAIGLGLALATVLAGLAAATRGNVRLRNPAYALPLGMLVFGLVTSVMESGMVGVMLPPLLTACCLMRMALFEETTTNDK